MYFYVTMHRNIFSTEDTMVAMNAKIKNMRLAYFDGKYITKVTCQLKMAMAIKRLEVLIKLPEALKKNVISIL